MQFTKYFTRQLQYFSISRRSVTAKQFYTELSMLAVAAASWCFVAEDRSGILEAQGQWLLLIMIEVEAADRSSVLRSQAQVAMMQTKGIQILPQLLTKTRREKVTLFKNRCVNLDIASLCQKRAQSIYYPALVLICLWQEIMHTAQSLYALLH